MLNKIRFIVDSVNNKILEHMVKTQLTNQQFADMLSPSQIKVIAVIYWLIILAILFLIQNIWLWWK